MIETHMENEEGMAVLWLCLAWEMKVALAVAAEVSEFRWQAVLLYIKDWHKRTHRRI